MSKLPYYQSDFSADALVEDLLTLSSLSIDSCLTILGLLAQRKVILNPKAKFSHTYGQANIKELEPSVYLSEEERADKYVIDYVIEKLKHISAVIDSKASTEPRRFPSIRTNAIHRNESIAEEKTDVSLLVNPLDLIAAIICETYAESGEDAVFADDEALVMIRDLLLEADSNIIERNRGRCLSARERMWDKFQPRS